MSFTLRVTRAINLFMPFGLSFLRPLIFPAQPPAICNRSTLLLLESRLPSAHRKMHISALLFLLLYITITVQAYPCQNYTSTRFTGQFSKTPWLALIPPEDIHQYESKIGGNPLVARATDAPTNTLNSTISTISTAIPQAPFDDPTIIDEEGIVFATQKITILGVDTHYIVFLKGVSMANSSTDSNSLLAGVRAFGVANMLRGARECSGDWVRHAVGLFPKFARLDSQVYTIFKEIWQSWYPSAETISFFAYDNFEHGEPIAYNFSWDVNSRHVDAVIVRE